MTTPLPTATDITKATPVLTTAEREELFLRIMTETETATATAVVSSYQSTSFFYKPMTYIALMLVLLLGAGGTVAASESAKPGDILFPIDRAIEQVRLKLADDDKKTDLEAAFIAERFAEVQAILDEERVGTSSATGTATTTAVVTTTGEERIAAAIAVLASELAIYKDASTQSDKLRDLLDEIEVIAVLGRDDSRLRLDGTKVRIDDDRIELRAAGERIRIEEKNGELRIKYDDDDHNSGFGNDSDDDSDDRDDRGRDDDEWDNRATSTVCATSTSRSFEAEADVFTDTTIVEVELRDQKTTFTMAASSTKAAVIAEIVRRYGLPVLTVEAGLSYEVENRASRPQDVDDTDDNTTDEDEDDDRGRDDEDDDTDDNNDEDRSGHGGDDESEDDDNDNNNDEEDVDVDVDEEDEDKDDDRDED
jgi:Domain of unknown function (DUF5667)